MGPETATAPEGWEKRLVAIKNDNTRGATGWCLEPHDLVLSKCVAGREKDWAFAREAAGHGLVDLAVLVDRVDLLPLDAARRAELTRALGALQR